jgi:ribosomal protein L32
MFDDDLGVLAKRKNYTSRQKKPRLRRLRSRAGRPHVAADPNVGEFTVSSRVVVGGGSAGVAAARASNDNTKSCDRFIPTFQDMSWPS